MQMRTAIVAVCMLVAHHAIAAPKSPGNPPKLAAGKAAVTMVYKGKVVPLDIWIEGRDKWVLEFHGETTHGHIVIPNVDIGTTRGTKAFLGTGVEAGREGRWVLELTAVSMGYLKSPGACSGRIAAWFAKDVYIVGTFENAGCISFTPAK